MVKAMVGCISEKHVFLLTRENSFMVSMSREWFPEDLELGYPVILHFQPVGAITRKWALLDSEYVPVFGQDSPLNFEEFIEFLDGVLPQHFQVTGIDPLFSTVVHISSRFVALSVGPDLYKVVVPKKWLSNNLSLYDEVAILIQPEDPNKERDWYYL